MREEALENQILEKDSKILEMEYKLQKKDRVSFFFFPLSVKPLLRKLYRPAPSEIRTKVCSLYVCILFGSHVETMLV